MKKRVLLVHPHVSPHGGGQAVAAWALEALKDTSDLSLLTWGAVDFDGVNRFFGTSLKPGDFHVLSPPWWLRRAIESMPTRAALLECGLTGRFCRRLDRRNDYDVMISTHNEVDFGREGVQYVHFPWGHLHRPENDLHWYHTSLTIPLYRGFCALVGGTDIRRIRSNLTLANSPFIAGIIRQAHGIEAIPLAPPVPGGFPSVDWQNRENSIVALGRMSGEKLWENAIDIVEGVRSAGHADAGLTLIATADNQEYERRIRSLVRSRPWVDIRTNIHRDELTRIVARHRYAIHPMVEEHFGIAVAEEQRAGCLPFVHSTGGPPDIVGREPALIFDRTADAIAKIVHVMNDPGLQAELRQRAAKRAELYTSERFMQEIRKIIEDFPTRPPSIR